jgi:hypothetical protein
LRFSCTGSSQWQSQLGDRVGVVVHGALRNTVHEALRPCGLLDPRRARARRRPNSPLLAGRDDSRRVPTCKSTAGTSARVAPKRSSGEKIPPQGLSLMRGRTHLTRHIWTWSLYPTQARYTTFLCGIDLQLQDILPLPSTSN